MPQVLIRNLDEAVIRKLKRRAVSHRRSLQAELKSVLEEAASSEPSAARVRRIRAMFAGRRFGDSTTLVRKDRAR